MNTTTSNHSMCDLYTTVVLPCLYSILFLVALALNSLAAWIFYNIPTTSTLMVYLKNVVVADMLMTLTIPVRVLSEAGVDSWRLHVFYCRYSTALFYLFMYMSIAFLGLISLDRYMKIVQPFRKYALQKVWVGQVLSATFWVVFSSLVLPNSILTDKKPQLSGDKLMCISLKSELGLYWYMVSGYFCQVVFWGTLALMVVCYTFISRKVYESYKASRSSSEATSRRIKAKVFVVVAVFFICFAPFHFVLVPYLLIQTQDLADSCGAENSLYIAKETTLWLSTTNVCLDPLIYIFLSKIFRRQLMSLVTLGSKAHPSSHHGHTPSTQLEMSVSDIGKVKV